VISVSEKLAFEVVSSVLECGVKFLETSSGLYLSLVNPKNAIVDDLKREAILIEETSLLTLADTDYFKYDSQKERDRIQLNMCLMFKTLLKSIQEKNNLMVLEHENEKIVVRFVNNNVFRVNCNEIHQITLNNSSRCYDKVQVSYTVNFETEWGFYRIGQNG
jgi:hypothetical protein